jgi:hypothetical protein
LVLPTALVNHAPAFDMADAEYHQKVENKKYALAASYRNSDKKWKQLQNNLGMGQQQHSNNVATGHGMVSRLNLVLVKYIHMVWLFGGHGHGNTIQHEA